ncbi:unnamed protein product [Symbiodinium sp. CCMP2592]|nr:unnamed protein product [Symbiodinium sp. CCMP2592]
MASKSLPLTFTTGSSSKAEINLDPLSGRPCLCLSVNLQMKLDIANFIQLLQQFAADSTAAAVEKPRDVVSKKAGSVAVRSEQDSAPRRKHWTWEEPMYSSEPWIVAYAQRPDVCWRKEELVSAGQPYVVLENEEHRQAFRETTFEPLPVPESRPMTHGNFKEAEAIRLKEAESASATGQAKHIISVNPQSSKFLLAGYPVDCAMNAVLPRVSEMRKHVGELLLQRGALGAVGEHKARLLLDIAQYSDAAEHKRVAEAAARLPEGAMSFGLCAMWLLNQLLCRDLESVSDAEPESQHAVPAVAASVPKRRRNAPRGGPRGLVLGGGVEQRISQLLEQSGDAGQRLCSGPPARSLWCVRQLHHPT